ncbi:MAG TPA: fused MFS/spermidine synthase, partial [Polyangiaceae bacterium LLY-WYZ-15_(1-7)]|nr:fused MFS/spermidine synthase [Polyangiaceae bacterium LLY-WYZ-15_(1-7)]
MVRQASPFLALFLSGLAALIYQTAWGRMLHRVFGVSDLAIATVLATFFLGLGLGSALGGRGGSRNERPARLYAALEIAIGAWALLSILLIPNVHGLYASFGSDQSFTVLTALRFTLALLILLPPTLLMGATLPVLIAAVSRRGIDWGGRATGLYATNTLGAVAGAGLTGLLLVPRFGARMSIVLAAVASFGAAAVVFAAMRALDQGGE